MKHTEMRIVPAKEYSAVVAITCDMCQCEIQKQNGNAEEVTVAHKIGSSYPEGGSGETVSVDLCSRCFEEKLVPWLKSQGAEPRTEEWDW